MIPTAFESKSISAGELYGLAALGQGGAALWRQMGVAAVGLFATDELEALELPPGYRAAIEKAHRGDKRA